MINESVHCFGPDDILSGIYSAPASTSPDRDMCVIFINAGLLHRVGPYRMFVDLARQLAALGLGVLRFDLSGLGESSVRSESGSERTRVVADIRAAMDFLETTRGHRRFLLVGLCSGADNAHWAALEDTRIAGAVMMDGPGYPNFRYLLAHYVPRLIRPTAWRSFLSRILGQFKVGTAPDTGAERQELFVRPFPPREQMEKEIRSLSERGMKLLFMYTGGVSYYYNHRSQFAENFPSLQFNGPGNSIEYEYNSSFDHTYSNLRHRRYLFERVQKWITDSFG